MELSVLGSTVNTNSNEQPNLKHQAFFTRANITFSGGGGGGNDRSDWKDWTKITNKKVKIIRQR